MSNANKKQEHRKDSRAGRTKKAISEALFRLLESEDFLSITVGDICIAAEVSRATFYSYFEDKYQLLRFCIEQFKLGVYEEVEHAGPESLFRVTLEHLNQNIKVFRGLTLGDTNREVTNMLHVMFVDDFTQLLEELAKQGKVYSVPIPINAVFLASGLSYLIIWWISNGFDVTLDEMAEYLKNIAVNVLDL